MSTALGSMASPGHEKEIAQLKQESQPNLAEQFEEAKTLLNHQVSQHNSH